MDEKEILRIIEQAAKDGRTTLDLSSKDIKALPPEIGTLKNLNELYIDDNKINYIPAEIGDLNNLNKLDMSKNQLSSLPLCSLPPEIGNLKNLTHLWLHGNQITRNIGNLISM